MQRVPLKTRAEIDRQAKVLQVVAYSLDPTPPRHPIGRADERQLRVSPVQLVVFGERCFQVVEGALLIVLDSFLHKGFGATFRKYFRNKHLWRPEVGEKVN